MEPFALPVKVRIGDSTVQLGCIMKRFTIRHVRDLLNSAGLRF
jgi:hypothetical protein